MLVCLVFRAIKIVHRFLKCVSVSLLRGSDFELSIVQFGGKVTKCIFNERQQTQPVAKMGCGHKIVYEFYNTVKPNVKPSVETYYLHITVRIPVYIWLFNTSLQLVVVSEQISISQV